MTTLPARIAKLPPPTPCVTSSMSPAECDAHRRRIAFEVEVVLRGYWQDGELAPEMKAAVLADWADELEDWEIEQVRWGLRQWRRDNPRRKPNPGDIFGILKTQRGKVEAAKMAALAPPPEPPRERITAERAAEILAAAGLAPKRIERAAE